MRDVKRAFSYRISGLSDVWPNIISERIIWPRSKWLKPKGLSPRSYRTVLTSLSLSPHARATVPEQPAMALPSPPSADERWPPLESSPEVFNQVPLLCVHPWPSIQWSRSLLADLVAAALDQFMWSLGVPEDEAEFHDVYGLDADALDMVPQPVLAVILCFPDPPQVRYCTGHAAETHPLSILGKFWVRSVCSPKISASTSSFQITREASPLPDQCPSVNSSLGGDSSCRGARNGAALSEATPSCWRAITYLISHQASS